LYYHISEIEIPAKQYDKFMIETVSSILSIPINFDRINNNNNNLNVNDENRIDGNINNGGNDNGNNNIHNDNNNNIDNNNNNDNNNINENNGAINNSSFDCINVVDIMFLSNINGGLGLTKHYGIRTECTLLINQLFFDDFLSGFSPDDFMHINNNLLYANEIIPGTAEGVTGSTELTNDTLSSLTVNNANNILKNATKKVHIASTKKIATRLANIPSHRFFASWFISQGSGTSSPNNFVRYFNGTQSESLMGKQNFIDRMRLLLCVGPYNDSSSVLINCGANGGQCKMTYSRDSDPLHSIHCHSNKGGMTERHTAIQFLLETLIRLLHPLDNVSHVQSVGFKHSSSVPPVINAVISDIIWEHGPISYVIDLVICQDDLMIED
jgi:hypothetical protein